MQKVCINLDVKDKKEAMKVADEILDWWDGKLQKGVGDEIELNINQLYED